MTDWDRIERKCYQANKPISPRAESNWHTPDLGTRWEIFLQRKQDILADRSRSQLRVTFLLDRGKPDAGSAACLSSKRILAQSQIQQSLRRDRQRFGPCTYRIPPVVRVLLPSTVPSRAM